MTPANWNSFDTAPRDGTKIIVKTPYGMHEGYIVWHPWQSWEAKADIHGAPKDGRWTGYDRNDNYLGMFVADFSKCGWLPFDTLFYAA